MTLGHDDSTINIVMAIIIIIIIIIDGPTGIMFSHCPSVYACVRAYVRRYVRQDLTFPTGLPSISSYHKFVVCCQPENIESLEVL